MLACKVICQSLCFTPPLPPRYHLNPEEKTLILSVFQVANVKKETTFHWYKEDDEIVPDTPPNVMSGACALPIPLVSAARISIYKLT